MIIQFINIIILSHRHTHTRLNRCNITKHFGSLKSMRTTLLTYYCQLLFTYDVNYTLQRTFITHYEIGEAK